MSDGKVCVSDFEGNHCNLPRNPVSGNIAKLLLCPKSGIPSRFCRKLWFGHLSGTLGRCGHLAAVPLPEAEIFQNPSSGRSNPRNMGESVQLEGWKGLLFLLQQTLEPVDFQALAGACPVAEQMLWRDLSVIAGEGIWVIQLVPNFLILWCSSFMY